MDERRAAATGIRDRRVGFSCFASARKRLRTVEAHLHRAQNTHEGQVLLVDAGIRARGPREAQPSIIPIIEPHGIRIGGGRYARVPPHARVGARADSSDMTR